MRKISYTVILTLIALQSFSQYTLKKDVGGVQFYTKWSHEKWYSKKSPKVLLVKIVNTTNYAVDFDLGVEFFMNLLLVEESPAKPYCLSGGKTLMPRISGLVYKPESADPNALDSFELSGLDVKPRDKRNCSDE